MSAQKALYQQIKRYLPMPLDAQLKAAVLQDGTLSLFVISPVWASRFRYLLPQLQRQLRENGVTVDRLRTRILPSDTAKPIRTMQKQQIKLSKESSKQLRQAAASIDDQPLRDAILRLSQHSED
ncbi:MAG: DciA family protein [Candidatus Thiodiazotropha sp. (ex. Lucinoma kazani)]